VPAIEQELVTIKIELAEMRQLSEKCQAGEILNNLLVIHLAQTCQVSE
jgi:hypothetical protein